MPENYFVPRRIEPVHSPALQEPNEEESLQSNDLQPDAAVSSSVQQSPFPVEDYTISVEQVREHFRAKGLKKSKDTVQRWCRQGELDCQKRGVLGRYFATETSLLLLEKKLLPDMIAENSGAVTDERSDVQLGAAAEEAVSRSMQVHVAEDAGARSDIQADASGDVQLHAAERHSIPVETGTMGVDADRARLQAENEGLKAQLENRDKQIDFLQDEIRSGREQRGAVVQISNRMLETLETMAIGGRLERPNRQGSAAVQSTETFHPETADPTSNGV